MLNRELHDGRPLRCATAGSVDDGKSTLLGRLLYDAKALLTDQLDHVEEASRRRGYARSDLALVTDGLRAEREQGITIDVAWRSFATPRRRFLLADSPGHVQYTRNMVTAASSADAAIVLVDARNGVVEQTRRHLFVARLLGVRTILVALNKMDLVGYSREVAARLEAEIAGYLGSLPLPAARSAVVFVPMSALLGENVVEPADSMPWYHGPSLLALLETLPLDEDRQDAPARFSVQWIIRPQSDEHRDYRGYAGRVLTGALRPGDAATIWPSGRTTRIERVEAGGDDLAEARAGRSVTVHLEDDLDVSRGDLLTLTDQSPPRLCTEFEADLAWVHTSVARAGVAYRLKHTTREVRGVIAELHHGYDIVTGAKVPGQVLGLNGIARARMKTAEPLAVDAYGDLRPTGSFLLIDPSSGATLAGGMIR